MPLNNRLYNNKFLPKYLEYDSKGRLVIITEEDADGLPAIFHVNCIEKDPKDRQTFTFEEWEKLGIDFSFYNALYHDCKGSVLAPWIGVYLEHFGTLEECKRMLVIYLNQWYNNER